ncbi:MAG: zinc ABC transporter substrate-binding protein [Ruminococcaceae bacterium]|nr:zinc ABC transporter substrate-binding protein [Oscillospiraceae bacterium]
MKKISLLLILVLLLAVMGCAAPQQHTDLVATTAPVYCFTSFLCQGTPLQVAQLISDSISCLHDYSLSVSQVRALEGADTVIISGGGLEGFMDKLLSKCRNVIDSSASIPLLECHEHHEHHHEADAHLWLDPENAKIMAKNICDGLCASYPQFDAVFQTNLVNLHEKLDALQQYADHNLADLNTRELITFHDGFSYMASAFDLTIVAAIEEESGSEASAKELIDLIDLIEQKHIPAIFTEVNGSASASDIISRETGVAVFSLDMGMNGDYFEIMYRNIDALKEALG